ncbi:hypothetical protein M408DRAFT_327285 [Serendipita vermifera MAFF 305830]|uniref:RRM domain-containing protein n=1 Tax=Serendipita vermifera MAFF 305830 TaxID=933852 RepID=A0A0C2X0S5_SERVB|nr:hypothetical protein M408DRAFT_327285 [Serendipita vermifera MAFF 305830]
MPYTEDQENRVSEGIVQSFIAAGNLPVNVTVEQLTQLFDAAGLVSNIKILDFQESQADGSLAKTAIIGYYSDETARNALKDLYENMALGLDRPLKLQYYGPIEMKEVEAQIVRRMTMEMMLNGVHYDQSQNPAFFG